MDRPEIKLSQRARVEGVLFACTQPIKLEPLAELLEIKIEDLKLLIEEIQATYQSEEHGLHLAKVAGGYQFRTKTEIREIMAKLYEKRPPRLTQATLEVLSIVAYKQPITRPEIEKIRGVDCTGVIKTLLERELIEMAGRSDGPGQAVLYRSTPKFMEWFQISDIKDLPPLSEVEALNVNISEGSDHLMELLQKDDGFRAEELSEVDQTLNEVQKQQREFKEEISGRGQAPT